MITVFNATFNNISVISWRSILFVEETGVPEKTTDLPQVISKLDHIILYRVLLIKNLNSKKDSKYNGEKRKDENTNYGHGQQSIEKIKQNEQH
jgi:hypothetical protein